jgi:hypothetical protein
MPSDLQAKLAAVSTRMAATRQHLQRLGEQTATLREEVQRLRDQVAGGEAAAAGQEWGRRVPTRPLGMTIEAATVVTDADLEGGEVLTDADLVEEPAPDGAPPGADEVGRRP